MKLGNPFEPMQRKRRLARWKCRQAEEQKTVEKKAEEQFIIAVKRTTEILNSINRGCELPLSLRGDNPQPDIEVLLKELVPEIEKKSRLDSLKEGMNILIDKSLTYTPFFLGDGKNKTIQ